LFSKNNSIYLADSLVASIQRFLVAPAREPRVQLAADAKVSRPLPNATVAGIYYSSLHGFNMIYMSSLYLKQKGVYEENDEDGCKLFGCWKIVL
jgi:hypothetical protein